MASRRGVLGGGGRVKAILEFDLPEDKQEFELAQKAGDYYSALNDIYCRLRNLNKYNESRKVDIEELLTEMNQILNDWECKI